MAQCIFYASRTGDNVGSVRETIQSLSKRLTPDNIESEGKVVDSTANSFLGIINPNRLSYEKEASVCLGHITDSNGNWYEPETSVPNGTFALFRSNGSVVELVSDLVGSRTIWYVHTKDAFVASTSQRAIVHLLGDYNPNQTAIAWMLSSGTLGPGNSWDRRINLLKPNSRLLLDKELWNLSIQHGYHSYPSTIPNRSKDFYLNLIDDGFEAVFQEDNIDLENWILPLSGGLDSRAIFFHLNQDNLKCITWGTKNLLTNKNSDAYIAKRLANKYSVDHEFFDLDKYSASIEDVVERFLIAGEGRIDHIAGYIDGFEMWRDLTESGVEGVIRGDSLFFPHMYRPRLIEDYENLNNKNVPGAESQSWPMSLSQKSEESLKDWQLRTCRDYRLPVALAALNDLKAPYVEVINPMLSAQLVDSVMKIPSKHIVGKSLFREYVQSLEPDIDFATQSAHPTTNEVVKSRELIEFLQSKLDTCESKEILSANLVDYLIMNIKLDSGTNEQKISSIMKQVGKEYVPNQLRVVLLNKGIVSNTANINRLALRAYIVCRMNILLRSDAKYFVE